MGFVDQGLAGAGPPLPGVSVPPNVSPRPSHGPDSGVRRSAVPRCGSAGPPVRRISDVVQDASEQRNDRLAESPGAWEGTLARFAELAG